MEEPKLEINCFLEEDLRHIVELVALASLSWKLELLLAMLETEDLSWEQRKEELSSYNYIIFSLDNDQARSPNVPLSWMPVTYD